MRPLGFVTASRLLRLPADRLARLNHQLLESVTGAVERHSPFTLRFVDFQLFPPSKHNLLIARFEAPPHLRALRQELWGLCTAAGVGVADDEDWVPHVPLGKFRATKAQVRQLSCRGLAERLEADDNGGGDHDRVIPSVRDVACVPFELMLVGEQPKREPLSWTWELRRAEREEGA